MGEFLSGQGVAAGEVAQDGYVEVMLELAEGALVLLLEGGLADSNDHQVLHRWRELGSMSDADRAASLPGDWLDLLTVPELEAPPEDPAECASAAAR